MPRVVPSQVVSLIDQLFPQYRAGATERNLWFNQLLDRCYGLQALLDLTDQIPPSLLVLNNRLEPRTLALKGRSVGIGIE